MNIADDLLNAFNDGYSQGRKDGVKEFIERLKDIYIVHEGLQIEMGKIAEQMGVEL